MKTKFVLRSWELSLQITGSIIWRAVKLLFFCKSRKSITAMEEQFHCLSKDFELEFLENTDNTDMLNLKVHEAV